MIEKTEKPHSIKLRSTSDGLHLDGSILWFDSHATGQLSFLSSCISTTKTKVPQVITTEETARILESFKRKPNALICQYNRPFSIGKLKMELLPSGSILGGASLYVETDKGRLLYAPQLQTHRISIVRQMQLKRAKSLALGAYKPAPQITLPNRKKELESLVAQVADSCSKGQWPVILCQAFGTAQEITKSLSDHKLPVSVHSSIAKVNKIYELYGSQLGRYSTYSAKKPNNKILLWPLPLSKNFKIPTFPDSPLILVKDNTIEHELEEISQLIGSYIISNSSDANDLKEVIAAVQPKELFLFGPYAKAYVEEFKNLSPVVAPLFADNQPTLF
ncbi:MAG: hypothetical protein R3B45_10385 [Bdellovibrionota bacterium]